MSAAGEVPPRVCGGCGWFVFAALGARVPPSRCPHCGSLAHELAAVKRALGTRSTRVVILATPETRARALRAPLHKREATAART